MPGREERGKEVGEQLEVCFRFDDYVDCPESWEEG